MIKTQIQSVSALPTKGLYRSIIADYSLHTAISELVDNSIDTWLRNENPKAMSVQISIDQDQQTIEIDDNAGGLARKEIHLLVTPGTSGNEKGSAETIGTFGVGAKRAPIALAQAIQVISRKGDGPAVGMEYDDDWIESPGWDVPTYQYTDFPVGHTRIRLSRLRTPLDASTIEQLRQHLEATYAYFIRHGKCALIFRDVELKGTFFDSDWCYPLDFRPRRHLAQISTPDGPIEFVGTIGLVEPPNPAQDDYGVYVYCNRRLIARALKTPEVGFITGIAGKPHHDVSIVRAIVDLRGPARYMPWNSTKSGLNTNSAAFKSIQNWLHNVLADFGAVSRRTKTTWKDEIFPHKTGGVVESRLSDFQKLRNCVDIPIPRRTVPYWEKMEDLNAEIAKKKPWAQGLYEGVVAVESLAHLRIRQKSRIALIVLDSTLEIGFKDFLVNESGEHYTDSSLLSLFAKRHLVVAEIRKHRPNLLDDSEWQRVAYFYGLRCKLVHERSSAGIDSRDVEEYRKLVQNILRILFTIRFADSD